MTLVQTELKNEYIRKEELVQKYQSSTPSLYLASSGSSTGTSGYYYGVAFTTKRIVKNPGNVYDTNGNLVTATNLDANTNYAKMVQHSSGGVSFYNGSWTDDDNIHVLGAALGPSGGAWRLNTSYASYKNISTIYTQAEYEELELIQKEIKRVTIRPNGTEKQIRPEIPPYLCFTAEQANIQLMLDKVGSPTSLTMQTSTDGINFTDYTLGSLITLSNIGDKVYFRNKSATVTNFSTDTSNYYYFSWTEGYKLAASGDINYLLCKDSTTTIPNTYCYYQLFKDRTGLTSCPDLPATILASQCYRYMFYGCTNLKTLPKLPATTTAAYCYYCMFEGCTSLTTAPELPATTLAERCYYCMFYGCTSLTTLPKLPATTLASYCYYSMFNNCTSIKLSATQTGEYQTPYRIPTTGTGTTASHALDYMFSGTGGTFKGAPTINTTYYTSNTLV